MAVWWQLFGLECGLWCGCKGLRGSGLRGGDGGVVRDRQEEVGGEVGGGTPPAGAAGKAGGKWERYPLSTGLHSARKLPFLPLV